MTGKEKQNTEETESSPAGAETHEEETQEHNEPEVMTEAEKLTAERDEYYDMMLRARADSENMVKRMSKERVRIKETAIREFIADMMPALDALHAAVCHPEEADAGTVLEGVKMMDKQVADMLQKNNIEIIEPEPGDAFDPNVHEAVMSEPSEDIAPEHIIESLRRGFSASGIIIRAAQVKVAMATAIPEDTDEKTETNDGEETDEH